MSASRLLKNLKGILCCAPVLSAPDVSWLFKLEVEACTVEAGAVLLQEDNQGVDHLVCYFSCKFNKHQVRYSTIEKETLALLWALQHFKGVPRIKCSANQGLHRPQSLESYHLEICHKKGADNIVADMLSCLE